MRLQWLGSRGQERDDQIFCQSSQVLWPEGRYSLEVWHCWVRCLLQIPVVPLPAGMSLLLPSPSQPPRCILAVVHQVHLALCCAASHVSGLRSKGRSYQSANGMKRDFSEGGKMAQETVSAQLPSLSPAEPHVLASQRFIGTCSKVLAKGSWPGRYWTCGCDTCAGLYMAHTRALHGAHQLALHCSSVMARDVES